VREQKGQFAKLADTITGTMRRRQRDREPRVLLYDGDGLSRRLPPDDGAHTEIVDLATRLVELADPSAQQRLDGER
jgi:hypothetical protein